MTPRNAERGFTLVELLVAVAVSVLVVAGAIGLLVAQQRVFRTTTADRAVQETGRIALEEVTTNLRLAGYGIDPAYAFDFGPVPVVRQERAPPGSVASAASTFASCTDVTCRDSVTGADEIVFRYRNPFFVHALAQAPASTTSITLAGPLANPIFQGQILQVMCFAGDMVWAYVTVGATVAATDADTVTVQLATGNGNQFPFQNDFLTNSCFTAVAPRGADAVTFSNASKVYKVDQFRYYVARYDAAGAIVTDVAADARPFLMLDQGLVDGGTAIRSVVSPDVEDLQFAYVFPNSPAAANQLVGATANTSVTGDDIDVNPDIGPPAFSDAGNAATRATQHPANIGAVAVSLVARMPQGDDAVFDSLIPAARNRPSLAGPVGYRRQLFETTTATRNLAARGPYFPSYSTSSTDRLNVGGG
jgi:type IV pilus assembly protein PilW